MLLEVSLPIPTPAFGLHSPLRSRYLLSWHLWYLHYVPSSPYQPCPTWVLSCTAVLFQRRMLLQQLRAWRKPPCCSLLFHQYWGPKGMRPNPSCLSAKLMILVTHRNWVRVLHRDTSLTPARLLLSSSSRTNSSNVFRQITAEKTTTYPKSSWNGSWHFLKSFRLSHSIWKTCAQMVESSKT